MMMPSPAERPCFNSPGAISPGGRNGFDSSAIRTRPTMDITANGAMMSRAKAVLAIPTMRVPRMFK